MQGGRPPTAKQKRWHESLRQIGCIASGQPLVQIHHLEGSTFRHKKEWCGQWWALPISWELHDVHSDHPLNVTHHKNAFHAHYGSPDILLLMARNRVLAMNPDADVPPDHIIELAHDYYEPKEVTDWYKELGVAV